MVALENRPLRVCVGRSPMKIDQGKCECVGWSPVKKDRLHLKNKGFGHRFLVLVRGDWRKESQFSLTTQDFGSS
jgi:hypothetical protein